MPGSVSSDRLVGEQMGEKLAHRVVPLVDLHPD